MSISFFDKNEFSPLGSENRSLLGSIGLWNVIIHTTIQCKKDFRVLTLIMNSVSRDYLYHFGINKFRKEN